MLEELDKQIKAYDKTVERLAEKYPDTQVIAQPNGVGLLMALVFPLTLEDKTRFKSSRQVGAYLGLRPKKDQSGETDKQSRITKAGDTSSRRLLVNCANYIPGPFGADSELRRWGLMLAERGGKNARGRAKVAVARKLAVLMHRLWVTGEEYQAMGYKRKTATSTRWRRQPGGKRDWWYCQREASTCSSNHEPPRPGDCVERLELQARSTDGSTRRFGPQYAPGPGKGPYESADGSVAER